MRDLTPTELSLLTDYLLHQLPQKQVERVEQWIAEDAERLEFVRYLNRTRGNALNAGRAPDNAFLAPEVDRLVHAVRAEAAREPMVGGARPPRSLLRRTTLGVAAVAVVVFGITLASREHSADTPQRYSTGPGQRSTIHLRDGSTVLLAPATTVAVTSQGIDVDGEAYFTVTSHTTRPFIVRTSNAIVQVLGTRFSVRQYAGDANGRVVVEDGRVTLQALRPARSPRQSETRTVLSSRMMALVTDSGVTVTSGISTREYTGWTQGMLVFNHIPLHDVVAELSRAYGTEVRVADSVLGMQKVIAEIPVNNRPLTQILDAIGLSLDAHYERQGNAFVMMQGRSDHATPSAPSRRNRFPQPERQYGR